MPVTINDLLRQYVEEVKKIYGQHLKAVILYGSYARGDYREDSDIDIMILLDLSTLEIEGYGYQLSDAAYDFNMDNDVDIKPIAKDENHFRYWIKAYPFYRNIDRERIRLYEAA
ncbi:MAG: nucleotidyltransferase domain-containing protein [Oscillospiraceae bacterium]|nr:nucleotidyltransferase domain-containing protein [Oscillospiraceae bacterium]